MKSTSHFLNRISERFWEWRLGIDSHGPGSRAVNSDAVEYFPVPFRAFFQAMKHVPNELLTGTFLDYGAGTGRALVLAARYFNFRKVVGVEIDAELCRRAELNFTNLSIQHPQMICTDAASYQPSSDTNVFFLYNPFFGETMRRVVRNIHNSLLENPRRAAVVVCRPVHFLASTAGQDWIKELATGKIMSSFTWRVFIARAVAGRESLKDFPRTKLA